MKNIAIQYNHQEIESKWQKIWEEQGLYKTAILNSKKPFYNLMMYPYPSAEGLHVGHVFAFSGADIFGRYQRMKGFDVFEPMGFDSGGIHSENFAIKMGVHPKVMTEKNIANFTRQLKRMGNMFDWDHSVDVMDPDYYRWTQWLFIQLFKAGLAYKKQAPITWCPSCKTSVSDEQTEKHGEATVCERCKTPVERKQMNQWFLRITDYAERLLANTATLHWSPKVLATQRNWIGKSEGAEITFTSEDNQHTFTVFTTRPDTLFGCTFLTLAPEHPLVLTITPDSYKDAVQKYIMTSTGKTEQERKAGDKDKTGVFTGAYVVNPVNLVKVPVWVSDYVLMDYGEGAVMGVPAHDERDFAFAKKFNLPIIPVIKPEGETLKTVSEAEKIEASTIVDEVIEGNRVWTHEGTIINSADWNGWRYPQDKKNVIKWLEGKGIGKVKTTFKLRDWNISRQRYWGPPIPMVYCESCAAKGKSWFTTDEAQQNVQQATKPVVKNYSKEMSQQLAGWYPVSDDTLPVHLPYIDDYLPDGSGKAPLARHAEFVHTVCPECGGPAQRETDVSDTFLDSSWYFLRYPSTEGGDVDREVALKSPFDTEITKKWLPVSQYSGGAEHSVLHLMYSRFVTMALHDIGHLEFEEPFPNFYAHGLIIKDGAKMSKSRGNVINPDEYMDRYGTDVMRLYMAFMGPYSEGGDFRDAGIAGMQRFVRKLYKSLILWFEQGSAESDDLPQLVAKTHWAIQRVSYAIENFKYNTAIAALMELTNTLESTVKVTGTNNSEIVAKKREFRPEVEQALTTLLLLAAPLAPHITEEIWQRYYGSANSFNSIHTQSWPVYDRTKVSTGSTTIVVQVNGKTRSSIQVKSDEDMDTAVLLAQAKADQKVARYLDGKTVVREVVVPGRLVNFVLKD